MCELQTIDISWYNITRYCTRHNNFESTTSVRLRTLWASYGCLSWVILRKVTARYREFTVYSTAQGLCTRFALCFVVIWSWLDLPIFLSVSLELRQWSDFTNASKATMNDTVKPVYNDHRMGYFSAFWSSSRWPKGHLDELQKAKIISKSKLVPSVFIKTHYWINHK